MLNNINLLLRFILEMLTLFATGYWMYFSFDGWKKYTLMLLLPLAMAALWSIFAVSGDPSRSGKTVIETPGLLRLLLEFAFFGCGVFALYKIGPHNYAMIFAIIVVIHYAASYERIMWLLTK